jgi:uncharacterized protein with GYD domain
MATYAMLSHWTERGIQNVKDAPGRIDAFKKTAKACGAEVREVYLALGRYDTISLVQAPDDETMTKLALAVCSAGNVRTETMRLFGESELRKLLAALP